MGSPSAKSTQEIPQALQLRIHGVVQGVGFRPFAYRLAHHHGLAGWVLNAGEGVDIHLEGTPEALDAFVEEVEHSAPPAAQIARLESTPADVEGCDGFSIRESMQGRKPSTRISPDLPICEDCLKELFDPSDRRFRYPFINCTNCGPRCSIIEGLPYDRPQTTMRRWPMCSVCESEYENPLDRRFHAQPVACPACGPEYILRSDGKEAAPAGVAIKAAARMLREGRILAAKGLGGYHLACDARNEAAVRTLRERKYRKEKPFALLVQDLDVARALVDLTEEAEALLTSTHRPIVLATARVELPDVAPGNRELGLMLPYTPLHYLLFESGAPDVLVMTSANRSSEPIAYRDDEALERLEGIADAFLVGERPIARRVDDSVARTTPFGPTVLRRARGYAPGAVARLPASRPILAVGADLKNTVTLVVDRQAFVSQHVGDLEHYAALEAFRETIEDLLEMYEVDREELLVLHDSHPQYASTLHAQELPGTHVPVQHHRAHIASVVAEREAWEKTVVGMAFDGTGYSDDGSIWGGEVFAGSLASGLRRVAHLHPAVLPGGDAAARVPVQAAAGFLKDFADLPDLMAPPFEFPERYVRARELVAKNTRCFPTTSIGRLFDTVAALLGFTREMTFEGQAAIWLEHQGRKAPAVEAYSFPDLDYRPLLRAVITDRMTGRRISEISRAFHRAIAHEALEMGSALAKRYATDTLVLSGGVFQNLLLLQEIELLRDEGIGRHLTIWANREVPPNDGGISLGQAALAAAGSVDNDSSS